MIPEAADEVFAARRQKPIVAIADSLIASAAYWIAAQATRIHASTSANLGSIGVFTVHEDISGLLEQQGVQVTLISHGAHKTDGHPYAPLPADVRDRLQARVDALGLEFERTVGRGRGVTLKTVQQTFGQGEVFRGKEAIARRMADGSDTFDQTLRRLTSSAAARTSARTFHADLFGTDDAAAAEHQAILAVLAAE